MLQDEAVRNRIRQAEEFLDPRMLSLSLHPIAHSPFLGSVCC